jgi:hypothetical protein
MNKLTFVILSIVLLLVIIGLSGYIYYNCIYNQCLSPKEVKQIIEKKHPIVTQIVQQPTVQQPTVQQPVVTKQIVQEAIQKPYVQSESVVTETESVMKPQQVISETVQEYVLPSPVSEQEYKAVQESQPESVNEEVYTEIKQEAKPETVQKTVQETQPETVQETQQTPFVPVLYPLTPQNIWSNEHNRVRGTVGQKPIRWNDLIASGAQTHANKCKFEHSAQDDRKFGNSILGENLGYGTPFTRYNESDMVKIWEDEKNFYKHPQYPNQSKDGVTGHYTQMINKNVTEFGCGCSNCNGNKLCVCRYNPIQMANQYPY